MKGKEYKRKTKDYWSLIVSDGGDWYTKIERIEDKDEANILCKLFRKENPDSAAYLERHREKLN